jgi:hypothetical protein
LAGGGELATGGDVTLVLERGQVNVPDPVGTRDLIYYYYISTSQQEAQTASSVGEAFLHFFFLL